MYKFTHAMVWLHKTTHMQYVIMMVQALLLASYLQTGFIYS